MSFTQPTGGTPASFLTDLRACTLDSSRSALRDAAGSLKYPCLALNTAIGGGIEWLVSSPGDVPLALIESRAFALLRDGTLQTDGSIAYSSSLYRFRMTRHVDGSLWIEPYTA